MHKLRFYKQKLNEFIETNFCLKVKLKIYFTLNFLFIKFRYSLVEIYSN